MLALTGEEAQETARLFRPDAVVGEVVPSEESRVFLVDEERRPWILRITPSSHRFEADIVAELALIDFLRQEGYPANKPLLALNSEQYVLLPNATACAFEHSGGLRVEAFGPEWTESFFQDWGGLIGRLHALTRRTPAIARFSWKEEKIVRWMIGDGLAAEPVARGAFARLFPKVDELTKSESILIHGDFGLANFHKTPTGYCVFDFDDCSYHAPAYDLAVALWPLRGQAKEDRSRYLGWLLAGYAEHAPVPEEEALQVAFDWRNLYMFAHRLQRWTSPDEDQQKWFDRVRLQLSDPPQWTLRSG